MTLTPWSPPPHTPSLAPRGQGQRGAQQVNRALGQRPGPRPQNTAGRAAGCYQGWGQIQGQAQGQVPLLSPDLLPPVPAPAPLPARPLRQALPPQAWCRGHRGLGSRRGSDRLGREATKQV